MIIIGSFVIEAIAVAFFVWGRIFRRQPKRQQFGGPWAAGGFVIGGGVDDHGTAGSHAYGVVEAAEATDLQPCLRFDEVDDGRRNVAMHGLIEDVVMRARKLQEL